MRLDSRAMQQAMALASRRRFIGENMPRCLKCRNSQVQLVYWMLIPAKFKCRVCKFRFRFEPFRVIT